MVGGSCPRRSRPHAASSVARDGASAQARPTAAPGQEAEQKPLGARRPGRAQRYPGRPPRLDLVRPSHQRAPATSPGSALLSRGLPRAAVHALAGVDRLLVQAIPQRRSDRQQPGCQDRRQAVQVPAQHPRWPDGEGLPTLLAQEAPGPRRLHRRRPLAVVRRHYQVRPPAMTDDPPRPRDPAPCAAAGTLTRSDRIDRWVDVTIYWKDGRVRGSLHRPDPQTSARGGLSLVAGFRPVFR